MSARLHLLPWMSVLLVITTAIVTSLLGAFLAGQPDGGLVRPALTPPDAAFPAIWLVLLVLMAAGALLVVSRAGNFREASSPLGLYFSVLSVIIGWNLVFFGVHDLALGLGILAALLLLVIAMMQDFDRYSRAAALLQLPALVWIGFVAYLNAAMWGANTAS